MSFESDWARVSIHLCASYQMHRSLFMTVALLARRRYQRYSPARFLFRIAVMNHAVKTGRWPVIGHEPLKGEMLVPATQIHLKTRSIRRFSAFMRTALLQPPQGNNAAGLERASVWEPEHVEDRLRAHYAGNVNHIVELLKLRDCGRTMLL